MHARVGGYLLVGVFVNFSVIGGAFTVLHVVAASLMLFAVAVVSLFFEIIIIIIRHSNLMLFAPVCNQQDSIFLFVKPIIFPR